MQNIFNLVFYFKPLFHKVVFIHPSINTAADLRGILCLSKLSASVCVRGWETLGGNHSAKQTDKKGKHQVWKSFMFQISDFIPKAD